MATSAAPGANLLNVLVDDGAPVRTVTVNRPAVLNALDARTLIELDEVFAGIERAAEPADGVRCVILTGAGEKAFVAGADIAAMSTLGVEEARRFSELGRRLSLRVEALAVPVIAAVNGFALGGGLELALLCDFIIAAAHAKFGQPEVNVGVLPGFGGTQRLVRRIGIGRARQLLYSGELVGADEARAMGLANEITPPGDLMTRCRAIAERIASRAPLAIAATKRALRAGEDLPLERGLSFEQGEFAGLFGTEDQKEGMRAFLEKRPPRWQGR
jgi:enoyl-CoA hydratase